MVERDEADLCGKVAGVRDELVVQLTSAPSNSSRKESDTCSRARVHPQIVDSMRELDIDLADRNPQALTHELAEQADVVVTMGCGDECPYIPGKRYIDWDLQDPAGLPLDEVRAIRDDTARRVNELVLELDQQGPDA